MHIHHDRVAGVVLTVFSAAAFAYAFTFPDAAALYVKLIVGAMLVLSVILWARTFHPAQRKKVFEAFVPRPRGLALIILLTLIYFVAVDGLGFYTASAIFIPVATISAGLRNVRTIALGTALYLGFVFVLFGLTFGKSVTPELILTLL